MAKRVPWFMEVCVTTCGAWLVSFLLVGWSSWITHSLKTKEESGIEFLVERDLINNIHLYTRIYIIYAYDIYIYKFMYRIV